MGRMKKKDYYPVFLDLSDKSCLVVGGGRVAERKVERLLACGAKLRVVSPDLTDRLRQRHAQKRFRLLRRTYRGSDLRGADLVFALTDRPALNRSIARAAKKKRLWVNVAKPGSDSNFILPALLRRRAFAIAVSTRGDSPARARKIKAWLEKKL